MIPSIDLVPFERAMSLRNLGFREPTDYTYYKLPNGDIKADKIHFADYIIQVSAPYFQEAFRWFRLHNSLDKNIESMTKEGEDKKRYFYQITLRETGLFINSIYTEDMFDSYEEAELACLDRLIKIKSD